MPNLRQTIAGGLIVAVLLAISFFYLQDGVLASAQPATTESTEQATPQVAQLIKQLGSDDADDRDAAQAQLVEIGADAIGALKVAAEKNEDPEIRSRAAAAMQQMKDRDANDASLVTLHRKNAPAVDVLDEIGRQSHAHFTGLEPGLAAFANQNITLDVDHKPFWDVMKNVCAQLNVCPVLDTPGRGLMRLYTLPRNWMNGPHEVVGPYWIGVASLYRNRTIDMMGAPTTDDQFSVRMVVYPEPKLAVTQMSEFNLKKAVDDAGNSLVPAPVAAAPVRMQRNQRLMNHMLETRLAYPLKPGTKIAALNGEITMLVGQDVQKFEMENVLDPKPKISNPLKNCAVQATVIRQGPDLFRVTIQCTRQGLSDERWNAMVDRMNDLTLEDAQGHLLSQLTMSINGQATESAFTGFAIFTRTNIGAGANGRANKVGEADRLTWSVATSLKSVTVPVSFKDLPMP